MYVSPNVLYRNSAVRKSLLYFQYGPHTSCSHASPRQLLTRKREVLTLNYGLVPASTQTRAVAVQSNHHGDAQSVAASPCERRRTESRDIFKGPHGLGALALALAIALSGEPAATAAEGAAATSGATLQLQQAYDKYSASYDDLDGGAAAEALGFPQLREKLLAQARGSVLEIAVGTGLNLPYYRWAPPQLSQAPTPAAGAAKGGDAASGQPAEAAGAAAAVSAAAAASVAGATATSAGEVTSLATVDLSPGMLSQARRRVEATQSLAGRPISFRQADVAALPFDDSSFDSVIDTFSLCVFPDPQAALNEMARVVRPASEGGRVLLLEHSRSDNPLLAVYQDATAGPVAALGKGCVWNQDVEGLAARAGLRVRRAERAAAGTVELLVAVKE